MRPTELLCREQIRENLGEISLRRLVSLCNGVHFKLYHIWSSSHHVDVKDHVSASPISDHDVALIAPP